MKRSLTASLSPSDASIVEGEYLGSPTLRKRLVELLIKRQELIRKQRLNENTYDSPNWMALQADAVGYQRALDEVILLISEK